MLDNKAQIDAFKILERSGLVVPEAVTVSRDAAALAKEKQATFLAMPLKDAVYPPSVSGYMSQIAGFAADMASAENAAKTLDGALSPYIRPSELLQMRIGWECHIKGHDMDTDLPFPLVSGMGDVDPPLALLYSLEAVETVELASAVAAINSKVGAGESGGGVAPVISQAEITALKDATEKTAIQVSAVNGEHDQVAASASGINKATTLAHNSMDIAVSITLSASLATDERMKPAIELILPDGVMDALTGGQK